MNAVRINSHNYFYVFAAIVSSYLIYILFSTTSDIFNFNNYHEENRNLFHYYVLYGSGLFKGDYIASFFHNFPGPLLYFYMTKLWAIAQGDLILLHRIITFACWLALLSGAAVAGYRVGGPLGSLATVALTAAPPVFLNQITSAVPHAFAFPLLIWSVVAILYGMTCALAALTLLAAVLYPPVAPIIGLALAWHVFITNKSLRTGNPNRRRDIVLTAVVGAVSAALMVHFLTPPMELGAAIEPNQNTDLYPENGPGGRHFYGVFRPVKYVFALVLVQFRAVIGPWGVIYLLIIGCVLTAYGLFSRQTRREAVPRLAAIIVPSLIVCGLALAFKPHFAYRFVLYPAFALAPLLFVMGLRAFCLRIKENHRHSEAVFFLILGVFLVSQDSLDLKKTGYRYQLGPDERAVMAFVAGLPRDSLIAAWPDNGQIELIPYVARRPLLVTYKAHYPTFEGYILEMRERMKALTDAYLATGKQPIVNLHCRWNVGFLIVNKTHFSTEGTAPGYFAPFDQRIKEILSSVDKGQFYLRDPKADSIAFEAGEFRVIDLSRFSETKSGKSPCAGRV